MTFKYTADSTDVDQRFIIPSVSADTTTLKVSIQNSASDTTTNTYTLATGVTSISSTSKVYFLQEMEDGKFEVYFGDDVLGNKLDDGNIIKKKNSMNIKSSLVSSAKDAKNYVLKKYKNGFQPLVNLSLIHI